MKLFKGIGLLLVAVFFTACYTQKETTLLQDKGTPDYARKEYQPYVIAINDELSLRVASLNPEVSSLFNNKMVSVSSQNNTYRVYPDSTVDLPYANKIKVAGLTLRAAQKEVRRALSAYGEGIDVKLAFANNFFTVIGEAGKGNFKMDKEKITVYEALAMAGDLNITGQYKSVYIIRGDRSYTFDIRARSVIGSEYYYIQPNDIIYVDRKKSSFVKVNSYSSVLGLVSTLITFSLTTWNLVVNLK